MPEGSEVRLSADFIRPLIQNKQIINCELFSNSRYGKNKPENYDSFIKDIQLNKVKVLDIQVKGKFMYWSFTNDWSMFCTFGMTGQWSKDMGKHPCIGFSYEDSSIKQLFNLYFNDPRHFGTIKFFNSEKILKDKLSGLGWDPLNESMNTERMNKLESYLSKTSKPIGQVLMDQKIFCGVGNYVRAEALYLTRLSPWRPAKMLSKSEVHTLCKSCSYVMEESYRQQGATILTYKTGDGKNGNYSSFFKVYGKKEDPQGNKVIKENTPDGRAIHWVPRVQS